MARPPRPKFTPTETDIIKVLSDGMAHTRAELFACLSDDMAAPTTFRTHLSNIRRKLQTVNEDIKCIFVWGSKKPLYQHVRLITSDE